MHTRSLHTVRFLGAVLLTLCLGFATAQSAQAESAARQALETSVTRILDIIKNPGYVNPATRAPLRRQIESAYLPQNRRFQAALQDGLLPHCH